MKKKTWNYRSPLLELLTFSNQDILTESEEKDNTGEWEEEWDE